MAERTVVAMGGDGIGPVVLAEARRVLDAAGFGARWIDADIGWSCWISDGDPLPRRTIDLLAEHRVGFLGAITSKPRIAAEAELPARLRGHGVAYRSPLLTLRQTFDLYNAFRPSRTFPGNPTNFVRRRADGTVEEPALAIAVFRENTEGLYAGVEWSDPPEAVRQALSAHPRFVPFRDVPGNDLAIAVRVVTRRACRRLLEAAFRYAENKGVRTIAISEKPNVLRDTSGLVEETARDVQRAWPDITLRSVNIDTVLLELARRPEDFEVIVATNLFGDLVSDAVAGLTGGLGFACSANLGDEVAIFEPVHGSAPRHVALDPPVVNPCAAILAGALLLDHLGEAERAGRVREAVAGVVAERKVRTYDMLGLRAGPEVFSRGAVSTRAMADAVIARLRR